MTSSAHHHGPWRPPGRETLASDFPPSWGLLLLGEVPRPVFSAPLVVLWGGRRGRPTPSTSTLRRTCIGQWAILSRHAPHLLFCHRPRALRCPMWHTVVGANMRSAPFCTRSHTNTLFLWVPGLVWGAGTGNSLSCIAARTNRACCLSRCGNAACRRCLLWADARSSSVGCHIAYACEASCWK